MDECLKFLWVVSGMKVDFRNPRGEELEETKDKVVVKVTAVVHAKDEIIRVHPRTLKPFL